MDVIFCYHSYSYKKRIDIPIFQTHNELFSGQLDLCLKSTILLRLFYAGL